MKAERITVFTEKFTFVSTSHPYFNLRLQGKNLNGLPSFSKANCILRMESQVNRSRAEHCGRSKIERENKIACGDRKGSLMEDRKRAATFRLHLAFRLPRKRKKTMQTKQIKIESSQFYFPLNKKFELKF